MYEETRGITYTPTFAVYKKGRKVRRAGQGRADRQGRLPAARAGTSQLQGTPDRETWSPTASALRLCIDSVAVALSAHRAAQVDQFFGANEQQLRDHMWLWTQPTGSQGSSG